MGTDGRRSGGNTIDSERRGALQRAVGARIAAARGSESQEKFAERAGISRQRLSAFETGSALPDGLTLTRLAPALGCSIDYLLTGTAVSAVPAGADATPRARGRLQELEALVEQQDEDLDRVIELLVTLAAASGLPHAEQAARDLLQRRTPE